MSPLRDCMGQRWCAAWHDLGCPNQLLGWAASPPGPLQASCAVLAVRGVFPQADSSPLSPGDAQPRRLQPIPIPAARCYTYSWDQDNFGKQRGAPSPCRKLPCEESNVTKSLPAEGLCVPRSLGCCSSLGCPRRGFCPSRRFCRALSPTAAVLQGKCGFPFCRAGLSGFPIPGRPLLVPGKLSICCPLASAS